MQLAKEIFELIFPQGIFEWFEITGGKMDGEDVSIVLEEKDLPPVEGGCEPPKIIARKFHEITVTDFPLRGKRTLLTFRRRYWKVEGQEEYLKRDIELCFPGTQLATEFANFLKEKSRSHPDVAREYRHFIQPPRKGV